MKTKNPKVIVMGGGTGVFNTLMSLKNYPIDLTAIVSIADDGGSSGVLREEFGILPPGDIRRALIALAPESAKSLTKLFTYRFENGSGLKGHSFGNLFITALTDITKNFNTAVHAAGRILNIKGNVVPVSLEECRLIAKLKSGVFIFGETNIDIPDNKKEKILIDKVFLNKKVKANPEAIKEIKKADYIIVGPGDLYTSIIPNFLVNGIKDAFEKSKAKKIYICNIVTKFSETNDFKAIDFLKTLEKYICKNCFDYLILNDYNQIPQRLINIYRREKKQVVKFKIKDFEKYKKLNIVIGDIVNKNKLLRHNNKRLGKAL
ncbi:MAG: YvcK family protein [Candidatus Pacebacteria bacterium]|nr:YvcK family protein [Candidatus Paceibacterota bacterium]